MNRAFVTLAAVLANTAVQAGGLDFNTRGSNAILDNARAQRDQVESMRSMERLQREQTRLDRQKRQNAERDSRSMRRFDR